MNNDDKQIQELAKAILAKAGWKLGGASLAEYLGVSDATLAAWLNGKSLPPAAALTKAVQLLDPDSGLTAGADLRTALPPK